MPRRLPTAELLRRLPTISVDFRLPTAERLRRLPTISDDFRFPNHCSPTEPIRGLPNNTPYLHDSRDQTNPQCCSSVHFKKRLKAIGWNSRYKKKTCDCLECKVLPSCKVWAQTDKNCKSYWPRLQFQVLCWPGVFNAIQDDEIHFLCYCPKYLKLRNEFFVQIKSHLHNFHELSYSDLVIKTINSKDMYLNYDWRFISHYWIICVTVYTVM